VPKRNRPFWLAKFAANKRRDRRVASALRRRGYTVVTVWECDTERRAAVVAARIKTILARAGSARSAAAATASSATAQQ